MIISDLQYIESVDTSEVQGGWGYGYSSKAGATGYAEAFGKKTQAYTNTYTFTAPGVSAASSNSYSSSKGYYHY